MDLQKELLVKKSRLLETEDSKNKRLEKVRIRMSQILYVGSTTQRAEILARIQEIQIM